MGKCFVPLVIACSSISACITNRPPSDDYASIAQLSYASRDFVADEGAQPAVVLSPAGGREHVSPARVIDLPLEHYAEHKAVKKWLTYFSVSNKERFNRYLHRGSNYRLTIEAILRQHGLPEFLYYLAMIESGFSVTATSHARAVGLWQFIPGTAKRYDLSVNRYVDERRDPIRATIAAARYLKDLHNVFQSWFLAMAAYNAGESRVMNAIMNTNSRNYWTLVEQKALPAETREYVPKIIAAAILGQDPFAFGLDEHSPKPPLDLKLVEVPSSTSLRALSSELRVSQQKLRYYNPQLLAKVTPPYRNGYKIWLPQQVELSRENFAALKRLPRAKQVEEATKSDRYRVRRGDTLTKIAAAHGMSVQKIKEYNKLRSTRIYPNQVLTLSAPKAQIKHYRVRRGDNLSKVAKRFGTTVYRIKKTNALRHNRIYIGQVLKITAPSS